MLALPTTTIFLGFMVASPGKSDIMGGLSIYFHLDGRYFTGEENPVSRIIL
jgi:hypothetical protein